eukprot:590048-Pyramimonas_sp.AAC.1
MLPAEAAMVDPQHRLILAHACEVLAEGGAAGASFGSSSSPQGLAGAGVFVGISQMEYAFRAQAAAVNAFIPTGSAHSA